MKKFFLMLFAMVAFGGMADAHADWWYYETPSFYTAEFPNEMGCYMEVGPQYLGQKLLVRCRPKEMDSITERVTIKEDGGQIYVETIQRITHADCTGGTCVDTTTGEYLGKLDYPADSDVWKGLHMDQIQLLRGFYLNRDPDTGYVRIYRKGTGPLADTFQVPLIENDADAFYRHTEGMEPVSNTTSQETTNIQKTYTLWCNPRGDFCDYTDDEGIDYRLRREELPEYIPIATDTSDCYMEVCHNTDMEVIGLNPNYHLFRQ